MLKINNEFSVFGHKVCFSIEEITEYKNKYAIELDNDALEYFLMGDEICELPDNITEKELHDLCDKTIKNNFNDMLAAIACAKKEFF